MHSPHEGLAGASGQGMSSLAYYQPEHPGSAGVVKYPENGHDTLSDFVTFVCQEAENTQQLPQVASASDEHSMNDDPLVLLWIDQVVGLDFFINE